MGSRGYYIIAACVASILVSYFGGHLLKESTDAMNALINLFSILAGVLVAVISIVGDPSMLLPGNWRVSFEHAKDMQAKIANYSHLFFIYIISLLLLVVALIVKDAKVDGLNMVFPVLTFFATFAILLSAPLPYSLMAIQKERMREETKSRKGRSDGQQSDSPRT
ncbi:hypothetical protein C8J37_11213 [Rhizobium sp. PP-WC-1G-195]|nr:hypothetical protein C8J37_11213 [Rhizobium sp. PP-WC-1G-195]